MQLRAKTFHAWCPSLFLFRANTVGPAVQILGRPARNFFFWT